MCANTNTLKDQYQIDISKDTEYHSIKSATFLEKTLNNWRGIAQADKTQQISSNDT